MPRRSLSLATAAAALVLAALPVRAHNLTPPASKVTGLSVTPSTGSLSVEGTATFGGQALLTVGTDPVDDFALPMYDLVDARIGQLDASSGDVTFALRVKDLPMSGSVPELARYIWDFGLETGGEEPKLLSIEGRFTDVVRNQSTRIPNFQLRGNCVTSEQNVTTCEKIADLTAEMIDSGAEIFVDVPKSILAQQAGTSIDGRSIVPGVICEGISAKVSPYFSACGGQAGPLTGDSIVQDPEVDTYTIGYKRVRVTVTPTDGGDSRTVEATLASNGSFAAEVAELAPGSYTVVAQACFAANCGTMTQSVSV